MVLCDCLVTDTGIFVNLFGLREFLSDTICCLQALSYARILFGNLVGYPGFLHRVSVGHVLDDNTTKGVPLLTLIPSITFPLKETTPATVATATLSSPWAAITWPLVLMT